MGAQALHAGSIPDTDNFFKKFFFMMMVEQRAAAQASAKRECCCAGMSASIFINMLLQV